MLSLSSRTKPQDCLNVVLAGRGGQGVVLAGHLILQTFLRRGLAAKRSEVHGMAQRGGSVVVHLRLGECVHSPVIPYGQAHFIMGIDAGEGARWAPLLASEGSIITLLAEEVRSLPHARFQNIAVLAKFCAQLQSIELLSPSLTSTLQSLQGADIEKLLIQKFPPELVTENMKVFNAFFKPPHTSA